MTSNTLRILSNEFMYRVANNLDINKLYMKIPIISTRWNAIKEGSIRKDDFIFINTKNDLIELSKCINIYEFAIKNKLQISIDYHILNLLDLHFSNLEKIYKCNINLKYIRTCNVEEINKLSKDENYKIRQLTLRLINRNIANNIVEISSLVRLDLSTTYIDYCKFPNVKYIVLIGSAYNYDLRPLKNLLTIKIHLTELTYNKLQYGDNVYSIELLDCDIHLNEFIRFTNVLHLSLDNCMIYYSSNTSEITEIYSPKLQQLSLSNYNEVSSIVSNIRIYVPNFQKLINNNETSNHIIVEYNKELDYIDLKYNCFNNDISDNDKSNVFKKIYKNMCQFNMYVALIISIVAFTSLIGTFTIFLFYISYMNLSEIIYNSKLFL